MVYHGYEGLKIILTLKKCRRETFSAGKSPRLAASVDPLSCMCRQLALRQRLSPLSRLHDRGDAGNVTVLESVLVPLLPKSRGQNSCINFDLLNPFLWSSSSFVPSKCLWFSYPDSSISMTRGYVLFSSDGLLSDWLQY